MQKQKTERETGIELKLEQAQLIKSTPKCCSMSYQLKIVYNFKSDRVKKLS